MAVKFPSSCLVFAALGAGIPFGSVDPVSTADERAAGYLTPPGGRIYVGEIPCIVSDTAITADNAPAAVSESPPSGSTPAPRSNLVKPKACRILFGTPSLARKASFPVDDLAVEEPSSPPTYDLIQHLDRIIDGMAETIAIAESALPLAPLERSPFGLKSAPGAVIARTAKKNLAANLSSDPIEYHSDGDTPRFALAILTPMDSDDCNASLLPVIGEDGEVREWSSDSPSSARHSDRKGKLALSDSYSWTSATLEDSTHFDGSTDTEIQPTADDPKLSDPSDGAYSPGFVYTTAAAPREVSDDERTVDGETAQQRTERLWKNQDRARRRLEAQRNAAPAEGNDEEEAESSHSGHPRHKRRCRTRRSRNTRPRRFEEEFTLDYDGHRVYTTPKENLIVVNEELDKLPQGTPGLARLRAMVETAATQVNRIDPSLPVNHEVAGGSRRCQRRRQRPRG